jgi:hypothetical protein
MKIVKGVLWGIAAALLYLIGLFFIVGNIDMSAVMLEFSNFPWTRWAFLSALSLATNLSSLHQI